MIAVVDYGLGNLGSVMKAFRHLGAEAVLSCDAGVLRSARALVLPGDGAFGATMDEIRRRGLEPLLKDAAGRVPLLGICIGMQVLFEESEEHGRHRGLGLLPGRVRRFGAALPVPHMGWNQVRTVRPHPLLEGVDGAHLYFVHSYFCDAAPSAVLATADYGGDFPAVVGAGSVIGVQFHPEKSQQAGLRLIDNFVRACGAGALTVPAAAAAGSGRPD